MVTVQVKGDLKSKQGYLPFVKALQAVFDLQGAAPVTVRWAEAKKNSFDTTYPPSIVIDVAKDHPQLAVTLHPMVDGNSATGSTVYGTPLILRDVQRWGLVGQVLGKYSVNGLSGVPEENEIFSHPKSLTELIQAFELQKAITYATPVVESIALLPVAPNGEFATEFTPVISFGPSAHAHYTVAVISQDTVSAYAQLSQGHTLVIKDINEGRELFNWKADCVPALSDLEKLMLPDQAGRMILIVTPVEALKSILDSSGPPSDSLSRDTLRGGSPLTLSAQTKGFSVEGVRIGRGSASGQGGLYAGKLKNSSSGHAVIYDLRFFAVRPDQDLVQAGERLAALSK